MYHLHTLRQMSYVYLQIFLTRDNVTLRLLKLHLLLSGCGRVVQGVGHKAKRLVQQCINGESSNPVEGKKKLTAQKTNSNAVWFNFQTYIIFSINILSQVTLGSSGTDILHGCHLFRCIYRPTKIIMKNFHPPSKIKWSGQADFFFFLMLYSLVCINR